MPLHDHCLCDCLSLRFKFKIFSCLYRFNLICLVLGPGVNPSPFHMGVMAARQISTATVSVPVLRFSPVSIFYSAQYSFIRHRRHTIVVDGIIQPHACLYTLRPMAMTLDVVCTQLCSLSPDSLPAQLHFTFILPDCM